MTSNYCVGTGIHEVTDPAIGLPMQGFADSSQKTEGVESALFSRAFIVEDQQTGKRVVIVSADLWAATNVVKQGVVERLQQQFGMLYTSDNVLISGTHTHSAPGGYAGYHLYDLIGGGFDNHTFECVVSGMVISIQKAHINLAPGKIYVNKGDIEDCGRNRSLAAYLNNPESERDKYPNRDTDTEMLLLKFTRLDSSGTERPIGALTWFAIHPTDRGQQNRLVCGDSKGYASTLFETSMKMDPSVPDTFVAAFANTSAGDVSGNVEFGSIPNGIDDIEHMQKHGRQQHEKARQLFNSASEELRGNVDFRHTHVDLSSVVIENGGGARTWPAALGLSFAAGSTEDSAAYVFPGIPTGLQEGIREGDVGVTERLTQVLATLAGGLMQGIPTALAYGNDVINGHLPKPILFAAGASEGVAPKVLPFQLLQIGQLVLTGVPAEFTTMAGRRLRETVMTELGSMGVRHLGIAGYANDYSQYVTTKEEYDMQHYEGASNLFGPHTLQAYQQEFRKLAIAIKTGNQSEAGSMPPGNSSPISRRWTFRNLSPNDVQIKFYNTDDKFRTETLINGTKTISAQSEVAFPDKEFKNILLQPVGVATVVFNGAQEKTVAVDNLVTITEEKVIEVTEYKLPNRWLNQNEFSNLAAGRSLWVDKNMTWLPLLLGQEESDGTPLAWLSLLC
jgi:neutral ceramidase